jgi:hypothetical protein
MILMDDFDGYKAFYGDFTNKVGEVCQPNNVYVYTGTLIQKKSGIHFCKRLEDVFKYFNGICEDIIICRVKVLGDVYWYDDEDYFYGEYCDLGVCNKLFIGKVMSRKEIIDYADKLDKYRFMRFVRGFRLNDEEIDYFENKFRVYGNIFLKEIEYYQRNDSIVDCKKLGRSL